MANQPTVKMECSICYDSLADEPAAPTTPKRGRRPDPKNPKNTSVLVSLPCGHIYHRICVEEWLITQQETCPSCRKKCEKRALRAVFLPTAGVVGAASSGSSATTGTDKEDDDDDKEKGKAPCGKCDQLAKQVEELTKEKEKLQKDVDVERKQVESLQKMLDKLTEDQYTTSPAGNGQHNTGADQTDEVSSDSDSMDDADDDGDDEWSW